MLSVIYAECRIQVHYAYCRCAECHCTLKSELYNGNVKLKLKMKQKMAQRLLSQTSFSRVAPTMNPIQTIEMKYIYR
jgi:hypothetical protein